MDQSNKVVYDGFNFGDNGLVLNVIDHLTPAQRENQFEDLANTDGMVLVQSQLGSKPVTIEGYYIGSSAADAQAMYDVLMQAINRQERPLIVPHAGGTRQYIATPQNPIIQEPDGLNRLTFSFPFVVPEGSAPDKTTQVLVDQVVSSASATIPLLVMGSTLARPMITLTFTSVTGGTGTTVSLRNARDFVGLTFSRTFVTGDVITIDSANFQIYINGVLTEPVGRMPTWPAGTGSLFYSDTFTARTVTITGTYVPRYL